MKRIYSLDFVKLLFAYIIALGHFGADVAPGGGVAVQLFYMISGFFLARKFYSRSYSDQGKTYSQWDYTVDHVKSLYPHYIFSLIVMAVYFLLVGGKSFLAAPSTSKFLALATDLYELIPEMFLLQNVGFFGGGINYPLWQLCALVVSGYFIYGLLCFNERMSRELIFPAAILMIQAFLKTDVDVWGTEGFFHVPLLRAFSPLCIGVLTYYITTTQYYPRLKQSKVLFNCAAILAFVCIFVFKGHRNVHLIGFPVFLLALYDGESWFNQVMDRNIFKTFGDFSYAIYLNHALIKTVLNAHIFPRLERWLQMDFSGCSANMVYLVLLTVYSLITLSIVNQLKANWRRKNENKLNSQ